MVCIAISHCAIVSDGPAEGGGGGGGGGGGIAASSLAKSVPPFNVAKASVAVSSSSLLSLKDRNNESRSSSCKLIMQHQHAKLIFYLSLSSYLEK